MVGGLEHFLFFHILGIIPTHEVIFFRGVGIPVYHQPVMDNYLIFMDIEGIMMGIPVPISRSNKLIGDS
jgi:hypothetical protein